MRLQELVAPVVQALVAIRGLLGVGAGHLFEPVDEQVLVLLEDEKLAEHDVGLVVALGLQTFAENLPDAGQVRHRFVVHGLGHEVAVLLRRRRHPRRGKEALGEANLTGRRLSREAKEATFTGRDSIVDVRARRGLDTFLRGARFHAKSS